MMCAPDGKIKISVIIPIFNMENYIGQCIKSILCQTLREIEIICIDDGSTDGSRAIMDDFTKTHKNVHLYVQNHKFSGAARNLGLQYAQGEFVAFMDADDYYATDDALEYLYMVAKREHVLICGGSLVEYDANTEEEFRMSNQIYVFDVNERRTFENTPLCCGYTRFIFDRSFLLRNNLRFPDYERFQDPPFFCRVLLLANEYYICKKEIYHARCIRKSHKYSFGAIRGIGCGVADILEMLDTQKEDHRKLSLHLLKNSLAPCIKFFYKWGTENSNEIDAMGLLNRLRKRITFREAFAALGWEQNCDLTKTWVEQKYNELKKAQEARESCINSAQRIAIYGAGNIGTLVRRYIQKIHKRDIDFFVVTSKERNPEIIDSVPVYEINMLNSWDDVLFIVAMDRRWHKEVCELLSRLGIKNSVYWDETMIPILWSDILYGCI